MKIGVLSDTHDFLDPVILKLFHGVDHILHAGDVGLQIIIFELGQIAPTTAVIGNTDLGNPLKLVETVTLGDLTFLVQHIVTPRAPDDKLKARLARLRPDVVVFGHTAACASSIPATRASPNSAAPGAWPSCIVTGKPSERNICPCLREPSQIKIKRPDTCVPGLGDKVYTPSPRRSEV
jgi:hypothetical protein